MIKTTRQTQFDVLLISVGDTGGDRRLSLPLALPVLKAVLVKKDFSVKCIDGSIINISLEGLYALLKKYNPRIVGFSATAYEVNRLTRLTRQVKSYSIDIPVILGGYCSLVDDLLTITKADVVCHGEGDETIVEITKTFIQKKGNYLNDLSSIKGISYYDDIKEIVVKNEPRPLIEDITKLPFPDFSDFNFNDYGDEFCIPIYSQRGCYNNCSFCDIIPFYGKQLIRSMKSPKIIEWLKILHDKYHLQFFNFTDDNFMSSKSFLTEFIDEFESSGLIGKLWINFQTRATDIIRFKEILPKMRPFIFSIELGIESFSDSQLKRYKKNVTCSENLEALGILNSLDIPYNIYYMFLDGETTLDEIKTNIDIIKSLPDVPNYSFPDPLPEIVLNYEYNSLCDLYGNQTVNGVDFLRVFYEFLQDTEDIRKIFVLYWGLHKLDVNNLLEDKSSAVNARMNLDKSETINDIVENGNTENSSTEKSSGSKDSTDNFQLSFLTSLKNQIAPKIIQLGYERLDKAYELAEMVFKGKILTNKKGKKKIMKETESFKHTINQILSPLIKLGMDFNELTKNI